MENNRNITVIRHPAPLFWVSNISVILCDQIGGKQVKWLIICKEKRREGIQVRKSNNMQIPMKEKVACKIILCI